jgi:hypothetical protein
MNKMDSYAILNKMAYRFTVAPAYIRGLNTNIYLTKKVAALCS